MKYLLFFLLLTASSAYAGELSLTPYLHMQDALSKDQMEIALSHHQIICEKNKAELKHSYSDCDKKFTGISDLRKSFKTLSEVYLKKGNKSELNGLMKVSCPMAKAKWVQKEGKIANPYYGKSMLECGEKI